MTLTDELINYDERMIGANHPTGDDTLNRALLWHADDVNPSHTITNILQTGNTANVNLQMGSGFHIIMGTGSTIGGISLENELNFANSESIVRKEHNADGTHILLKYVTFQDIYTDFIAGVEAMFTQLEVGGGAGDTYEGYYSGYYGEYYDTPGGLTIDAAGDLLTDGTISGTHLNRVREIASNYSVTIRDSVLLIDASLGNINLTLPGIVTTGHTINIKKIDASANEVIINGIGNTIDGDATKTITTQYNSITIVSDGSNWFII